MRPDRAVVKKAIADASGNLSRAAALLGCTRQTLYTWCYQLGLERFAGIRLDARDELDKRERMDSRGNNSRKKHVYSAGGGAPNLHVVASQETVDMVLPVTVKLPESIWKLAKIEAIRQGCTVSDYVRRALETSLQSAIREEEAQ